MIWGASYVALICGPPWISNMGIRLTVLGGGGGGGGGEGRERL